MSQFKGTPGPWSWYGDELLSPYDFVLAAKNGRPNKANAQLIAAAPELLEALIAMEAEKSDYMVLNKLGNPAAEHTNKIARAAIAKAIKG